MTLLPGESWNVEVVDGPHYRVGPWCAVPFCPKPADHAHHLWRRSFTGRPATWVRYGDTVYGNLVGLCADHHLQVTDNTAWIRLVDELDGSTFMWCWLGMDKWITEGPISPQPPVDGQPSPAPASAAADGEKGLSVDREAAASCPTCGHKRVVSQRVRLELPVGERRPRASWSISVPKDERENGANVLDELLQECAKTLGRHEHQSWKYFTLVETLVAFVQHGHLMVKP